MSDGFDARSFGQLEGSVTALEEKVKTLSADVERLTKAVEDLTALMNQVRGGWWVVAGIASLSGVIGASVGWLATHVVWKG